MKRNKNHLLEKHVPFGILGCFVLTIFGRLLEFSKIRGLWISKAGIAKSSLFGWQLFYRVSTGYKLVAEMRLSRDSAVLKNQNFGEQNQMPTEITQEGLFSVGFFGEKNFDYLIIGSITEFGRKNVGDVSVFSRSKTQTVQAGVNIRLIDVSTGQIIYSEESKGEAETTNKTVMGLGKQTDYDATLSDKAISAAISKLVENIINNCMDRPWKSYFLAHDENGILISGGKSQGIKIGDIYDVVEKGRSVKNPQTGMMIELPGKPVGKIKIDFTGGDTPINEFSMVTFSEGGVDKLKLNNYFIKEIK